MAKIKLDNVPLLPDVHVIAISSHVNDYRLCWALNRSLGLELVRRRNNAAEDGPPASLPAFDHVDPEAGACITLVGNHTPEGVLVAGQRQADYFLLLDEEGPWRPEEALDGVRRADFVLAAYPLDIRNIKGAYKLLE